MDHSESLQRRGTSAQNEELKALSSMLSRAPDLPELAVECIFGHLPMKQRARCEAVCRCWRSASRSSTSLWQYINFRAFDDEDGLAKLRWLSGRGPVRVANLQGDAPADVAPIAFSLGRWADTLQVLRLHFFEEPVTGINFLGCLQQLTMLNLGLSVTSVAEVSCVSSLGQLRSLRWVVFLDNDGQVEELPLPSRLQHLEELYESWRLPDNPATLARLQTLSCEAASLPALPQLPSLTGLQLHCQDADVPAGLSALTALHTFQLHCTSSSAASLSRALSCFSRLECLSLRHCDIAAPLELHSNPTLRCLDIELSTCTIPAASWLASLELLWCSWDQVPPVAICAATTRLRKVVIGSRSQDRAPGLLVAHALEALRSLPSLEALHFDANHIDWTEARVVVAALGALHQARPGLCVDAEGKEFSSHGPWSELSVDDNY